ncbi:uncharacterized protein N7482_008985 [Penicillium canariense]|uniref:DUF7779 domain-containing protein n=1 Tax=Penicillium canariense TaxID=189055 RepID=A0A9W9LJI7_9EURO|nr:uncharacterized protein N7482_008985 [Penicillium canariense]KAJ5157885.1 hypothetical protein N7482_008985 [Penicillium canariense]
MIMASTISFGTSNSGFQVGSNFGSINIQTWEELEIPPKPLSTVPFASDTDFIDRGMLLEEIHRKSSIPGSRTALVGLGGVGKSKVAIEYSYRIRENSPETWVFWIHASNATRFEQSFQTIAETVKIPGRRDRKANIFRLVSHWLQDNRCGNWVLIMDNVDDDFLCKPPLASREGAPDGLNCAPGQPLLSFLPQVPHGSIILTTRSKQVALSIVDSSNLIQVEPMGRSNALALLQKKLGTQTNQQEALLLIEALDFMPLAIVQATTYIRSRAPRCSVAQYLIQLQKSDNRKIRLLGYDADPLYRDWEASNSILTTWQISFNHIRKIRPSAADLLSLMSFFDRQGIAENLLQDSPQKFDRFKHINDENEGSGTESEANNDFEDDIKTLTDYSFISISQHGTLFEMHRLVQLATHRWLKIHGKKEHWKQRFTKVLSAEFPTGEYEHWVLCQSLFPHVKLAMSQRPDSEASLREWAALLHNGAMYAWRKGNMVDMKEMATRAMETREHVLGPEHEDTIASISVVGLVYLDRGQLQEAETLHFQVLETCKKVLGAEHPRTLTSMANLGSTYETQGRFQEAEALHSQVLETRKKLLGTEHLDTLTSMSRLVSTYQGQGRWQDAEIMSTQLLKISRKVVGEEHPDTLSNMAKIAMIYQDQGRFQEAETLQLEVVEAQKKVLGLEHPRTLTSIGSLASTYGKQGRLKETEKLQLQVLESRKRLLGAEHLDTLTTTANIATTYWRQDRFQEAKALQTQVLMTCKRTLGLEHPATLANMANLASTCWKQGLLKEAEKLQSQVLEISKSVSWPRAS